VTSQAQHLAYLEQHPYEPYSQEQLAQVRWFIMNFVHYHDILRVGSTAL
jgi:hypothetical protein